MTLTRDGISDSIRDRHFTFLTPAVPQNHPLGLSPVPLSEGIGRGGKQTAVRRYGLAFQGSAENCTTLVPARSTIGRRLEGYR